jgi:hypothetical protein
VKLYGPAVGSSRAQLVVMPLAAMVPLGIITVALGLAGLGMGGVHYAFTGEVRDRLNCPSPVGPRFASNQAPLNTLRALAVATPLSPPLLSCAS